MITAHRKLQTLQISRGVAALFVLLFHLTSVCHVILGFEFLKGVFYFGYSGVDFFFVLSGFIIYFVHHEDVSRPRRLRSYLRRRFLRIYPVYWIVALSLLPVYFSYGQSKLSFSAYLTTVVRSLLLLPQSTNPLVTAAWSLTFEVLFYCVFAFLIYFPKRMARPLIAVWLLLSFVSYLDKMGVAVYFNLFQPYSSANTSLDKFVFNFYNLEFAMGCTAAYLLMHYHIQRSGKLAVVAATGFLACGILNSLLFQKFARVDGVLIYGVPAALFVWGVASWERGNGVVLPPVFLLLGDASYSIYLTHFALLDLLVRACIFLNIPALAGLAVPVAVIFSLTLVTGILFFIFVERPLLRLLRRPEKRSNLQSLSPQAFLVESER